VSDWSDIGKALDLKPGKLEEIESDTGKAKKRMEKVLLTWMYGNGKKPVTWNTLLGALRDPVVGKGEEADKIQKSLQTPTSTIT